MGQSPSRAPGGSGPGKAGLSFPLALPFRSACPVPTARPWLTTPPTRGWAGPTLGLTGYVINTRIIWLYNIHLYRPWNTKSLPTTSRTFPPPPPPVLPLPAGPPPTPTVSPQGSGSESYLHLPTVLPGPECLPFRVGAQVTATKPASAGALTLTAGLR